MLHRRAAIVALGILTIIVSHGLTRAQEAKPAAARATQTVQRYHIGVGDVLEVRVYNRPQLSREAVRVEGNGMIRMPLVDGEIQRPTHPNVLERQVLLVLPTAGDPRNRDAARPLHIFIRAEQRFGVVRRELAQPVDLACA